MSKGDHDPRKRRVCEKLGEAERGHLLTGHLSQDVLRRIREPCREARELARVHPTFGTSRSRSTKERGVRKLGEAERGHLLTGRLSQDVLRRIREPCREARELARLHPTLARADHDPRKRGVCENSARPSAATCSPDAFSQDALRRNREPCREARELEPFHPTLALADHDPRKRGVCENSARPSARCFVACVSRHTLSAAPWQ